MIDPDGQDQGVEPFIVQCRMGNGKFFSFGTIMIVLFLFITLPIMYHIIFYSEHGELKETLTNMGIFITIS